MSKTAGQHEQLATNGTLLAMERFVPVGMEGAIVDADGNVAKGGDLAVGGFALVKADSLEEAAGIAKALVPGGPAKGSLEVRKLVDIATSSMPEEIKASAMKIKYVFVAYISSIF